MKNRNKKILKIAYCIVFVLAITVAGLGIPNMQLKGSTIVVDNINCGPGKYRFFDDCIDCNDSNAIDNMAGYCIGNNEKVHCPTGYNDGADTNATSIYNCYRYDNSSMKNYQAKIYYGSYETRERCYCTGDRSACVWQNGGTSLYPSLRADIKDELSCKNLSRTLSTGTGTNATTVTTGESLYDCNSLTNGLMGKIKDNILIPLKVIAPILLLIFTTMDFAKAVFSDNKDGMKKAGQNFVKRAVATIIVFFASNIIAFITGLVSGVGFCIDF